MKNRSVSQGKYLLFSFRVDMIPSNKLAFGVGGTLPQEMEISRVHPPAPNPNLRVSVGTKQIQMADSPFSGRSTRAARYAALTHNLGVPSPFVPGILLSGNHKKGRGNSRLSERTWFKRMGNQPLEISQKNRGKTSNQGERREETQTTMALGLDVG